MIAQDFTGLVLLFNTCADPSRAARLHAANCPMLNTAKRGRKAHATSDDLPGQVSDLEERGYPVKRCKCCKPAK